MGYGIWGVGCGRDDLVTRGAGASWRHAGTHGPHGAACHWSAPAHPPPICFFRAAVSSTARPRRTRWSCPPRPRRSSRGSWRSRARGCWPASPTWTRATVRLSSCPLQTRAHTPLPSFLNALFPHPDCLLSVVAALGVGSEGGYALLWSLFYACLLAAGFQLLAARSCLFVCLSLSMRSQTKHKTPALNSDR